MKSRRTRRLKRRSSRKVKRTSKVSRKRTRKVSRKGRKVSQKRTRKVSRKGRRRLKGGFFDTIKSSLGNLSPTRGYHRMKAEASFLTAHPGGLHSHMHGTKRTLCGGNDKYGYTRKIKGKIVDIPKYPFCPPPLKSILTTLCPNECDDTMNEGDKCYKKWTPNYEYKTYWKTIPDVKYCTNHVKINNSGETFTDEEHKKAIVEDTGKVNAFRSGSNALWGQGSGTVINDKSPYIGVYKGLGDDSERFWYHKDKLGEKIEALDNDINTQGVSAWMSEAEFSTHQSQQSQQPQQPQQPQP